jgi:hypothetical protein
MLCPIKALVNHSVHLVATPALALPHNSAQRNSNIHLPDPTHSLGHSPKFFIWNVSLSLITTVGLRGEVYTVRSKQRIMECLVRFWGFTTATMKKGVFWDVAQYGSCKNRCFEGTQRLHHHGEKNRWTRNKVSRAKFEVFTAVTMKNSILWDVTPCGSCKNRRFGGT